MEMANWSSDLAVNDPVPPTATDGGPVTTSLFTVDTTVTMMGPLTVPPPAEEMST